MPYNLFINRFNSDWHIAGISHESFHAFQASRSYNRVKEAEKVTALGNSYPWQNSEFRADWVKERQLLAKAIIETNEKNIEQDVREWLAVRKKRRAQLAPDLVHCEQEREWLEGLAKYAELKIWELAAETKNYHPLPEMQQDPDFNFYRGAEDQRKQEIRQLRSDLGFSESMFYYSGWAQAEILDRLYPDWKSKAFEPGVYLDELLKEVNVATTK